MIRTILLLMIVLFFNTTTNAQISYKMPESIKNKHIEINFLKVKPTSSSYFINYKIKNTGKGILFIDRKKTKIYQNKGVVSPNSGNYSLKSGKSRTIYNEIRAKAPVQPKAEIFKLTLDGLRYAKLSKTSLKSSKLVIAEKATQKIGDFHVKVMTYNVYPTRKYAQIKITFNGDGAQVGAIDLTKIKVMGGSPKIVKKGDALLPGKSYTFAINLAPNKEEFAINWDGVFNVMAVSKVAMDTITVKSTTYKEVKPKKEVKPVKKKKQEIVKNCELSFSDFSSLKTKIKEAMNNGGKSIEIANTFLTKKECISTAQVLEYLSIFNLDGTRLKFAKMAYKFCSDKQKYHQVVGKMAYTKNKQNLEEFLEHQ